MELAYFLLVGISKGASKGRGCRVSGNVKEQSCIHVLIEQLLLYFLRINTDGGFKLQPDQFMVFVVSSLQFPIGVALPLQKTFVVVCASVKIHRTTDIVTLIVYVENPINTDALGHDGPVVKWKFPAMTFFLFSLQLEGPYSAYRPWLGSIFFTRFYLQIVTSAALLG